MYFLFAILMLISFQLMSSHSLRTIQDEWVQDDLPPFNELILSWNGSRPEIGKHEIYVSVKVDSWTEWLPYATWGKEQSSYSNVSENGFVKVFQDTLDVLENKKATGFKIKVISNEGALNQLHVYINSDIKGRTPSVLTKPISIPVPGISQMALKHPQTKTFAHHIYCSCCQVSHAEQSAQSYCVC